MIGTWIAAVLAVGLSVAVPDPHLTPGAVRPLTHRQVCTTKWSRDERHVTVRMKREVATRYGLPWPTRGYVYDHLIPRELGGADVVDNLWPQPRSEAKHIKDPEENRLHRAVCRSEISLEDAQAQMRTWGQR
jgi:hypothetical protein